MLTRLYVDNYKCLVNFEFRPSCKQLIIGRNGTGKSTALDVLSLLRDFSIEGAVCDDRLGGSTKTRWQTSIEQQRFELDIFGNGAEYSYVLVVDDWPVPSSSTGTASTTQLRPRVVLEEVLFSGKPIFRFENGDVHLFNDKHEDKVQYPFDWHRSALATIQTRWDNTKLTWFKHWLSGVVHVQINPWAIGARSEQEAAEPARNMSNFADWFRHLKLERGNEIHKAIGELREAIPGLESLDAKEAGLNVKVVQAGIRDENNGKLMQFSLNDLSEGQRALISLYTLLFCAVEPNATVLLDEPDNFIALNEIQPWLFKLLDRVDDQKAQVIVVSHHPELLNQLAGQGGVILNRPGGFHTRIKQFESTDETGLTPAELIARGWESA
jgi:predicted ATPase